MQTLCMVRMYGPSHYRKETLRTRRAVCVYVFGLQAEIVLLAKILRVPVLTSRTVVKTTVSYYDSGTPF